jgi:hypothetical protein
MLPCELLELPEELEPVVLWEPEDPLTPEADPLFWF